MSTAVSVSLAEYAYMSATMSLDEQYEYGLISGE